MLAISDGSLTDETVPKDLQLDDTPTSLSKRYHVKIND